MPVVEVSRRMAKLAQWTRYEIWVICIWAVLFSIVYLRTAGYHELSTVRQIGYWVFMSIWFAGIYCFFYKRFNKNIAHVRKNLEELEDVCTE